MYCQLSDNGQRSHLPSVYIERLQRISRILSELWSLHHSPFSSQSVRKFLGPFPSSEFGYQKSVTVTPAAYAQFLRHPSFRESCQYISTMGSPRALLNRCNPTIGPKTVSQSITRRAPCPVNSTKSAQTPLVNAPAEARDRTD